MTITTTLQAILESRESVAALASMKLPVSLSYKIAKFTKAVDKELELYDRIRLESAQELGTRAEDGSHFTFQEDRRKIFEENHKQLLATEITLNALTCSIKDFQDVAVEPRHIARLLGLLIADEE